MNRAFGVFEVTHDCTDLTSASFLAHVGKKTECMLRISTVGPERGSADTVRDVHGWAMKFYTDEGNLDWVLNNTVSLAFVLPEKQRNNRILTQKPVLARVLYQGSHQISLLESIPQEKSSNQQA